MLDFKEFDLLSGNTKLRWRDANRTLPRLSPYWYSWLLDPGSLTQRLKNLGNGDFRVELIEQRWIHSTRAVKLDGFSRKEATQRLWSRKVVLMCAGEPCVAAHTLIPICSMRGPLRQLRRLETKPLGEFLFKVPHMTRGQMKLGRTKSSMGRYSVFRLQGFPVLVAEYYLPGLQRVEEKTRPKNY